MPLRPVSRGEPCRWGLSRLDPVTHTLAGAALAETGLKQRTALGTATLLLAANLPDIDVAAYLDGPMTALWFRRGITHGVLAWIVLPLLLTGAVMLWDRWVRRWGGRRAAKPVIGRQILVLATVGVATHPMLDLLNTYGIRLLMPFSDRWFYGDSLFIVDPWAWAVLASGVYLARRRRRPAMATAALAALVVYVGAMAASNVLARRLVVREATARGLIPGRLMVAPRPVNPLRRRVVVDDGERYHFARLRWLGPGSLEFQPEAYPRHPAEPLAAVATRGPEVRKFLSWARFPFSVVERRGEGHVVHVGDARYTLVAQGSWASVSVELP